MTDEVTVRPAIAADLAAATSWLSAAGLPTSDLTLQHMQRFLVALLRNVPVGMIGLEQFDRVGLLRSLVVDPSIRNGGVGRKLVAELESKASRSGITELWLLTIDADAYFSKQGYDVMSRTDAPESIRSTAEFSSLCPGDAVLMRKVL